METTPQNDFRLTLFSKFHSIWYNISDHWPLQANESGGCKMQKFKVLWGAGAPGTASLPSTKCEIVSEWRMYGELDWKNVAIGNKFPFVQNECCPHVSL